MRINAKCGLFRLGLLAVLASSDGAVAAGPIDPHPASIPEAVDKLLASQLIDPTTAIQYRVSESLACKGVLDGMPDDSKCVCYSVNAKNRYGAYAGATVYAAPYVELNGSYLMLPGFEVEGKEAAACEKSGMAARPASKIAELVTK